MTDGCGVVAFALPLRVIATMYARLPETGCRGSTRR